MKLKDLLSEKKTEIEYRTYEPGGQDMFAGYCVWDGQSLMPCDGDSYSIDDEISFYDYTSKPKGEPDRLTIWYKSSWIYG